MEEYDILVFIGRFQPFHHGHAKVIQHALNLSDRVIVLIGSANAPRSWRNPFTYEERKRVIEEWFFKENDSSNLRLIIHPLNDYVYNEQCWITEVQETVNTVSYPNGNIELVGHVKIGLIGHSKDHTSYYLGLFPQWGSENVEAFTDRRLFNSTDVRHVYFGDNSTSCYEWTDILTGLPKATFRFLDEFRHTPAYRDLCEEHRYLQKYREDHAYRNDSIPYSPTHTAVDAVVIQSGHILLVERNAHPGKGLVALPGGFVQENERLVDAMLRELREETRVKVPAAVLRGNIKRREVFDDPHRSARGRVFSHTFLIELPPQQLPKVKGSSDAKRAWWQPLSGLDSTMFFEDHFHIIRCLIGTIHVS